VTPRPAAMADWTRNSGRSRRARKASTKPRIWHSSPGQVDPVPGQLHQQLGVERVVLGGLGGADGTGAGLAHAVHADHGGEEDPPGAYHAVSVFARGTRRAPKESTSNTIRALSLSRISG